MGNLISLLVVGVVYLLAYLIKNRLSKIKAAEPVDVMDESFQQINMPEPETVAAVTKKKDAGRKKSPLLHGEGEAVGNKEHRSTSDSSVEKEQSKDRRFGIAGRSEAKRAFIYSEIFNRKYQ